MIIPAAGLGSRLKSSTPKVLFPVNGRPMIDYLLDLYAPIIESFVFILNPAFVEEVQKHCSRLNLDIQYEIQKTPSGMLDAIMTPRERIRRCRPQGIWVTWCDQIAVHPKTVSTLSQLSDQFPQAAMILPTITKKDPYIHFVRDAQGVIVDVLHAREGDQTPEVGENDIGLFRLSCEAYLDYLPTYSQDAPLSKITQERNFLPFIPWLHKRAEVRTFSVSNEIESVGINNIADLQRIESYLGHGR